MKPYGRIVVGAFELIVAVLILTPKTIWVGGLLTLGIISGAILMHLTNLGIEVNEDGGALFYMAILIFILTLGILWIDRKSLPFVSENL